jgi:integral membrane sensor domain MASE1
MIDFQTSFLIGAAGGAAATGVLIGVFLLLVKLDDIRRQKMWRRSE